MTADSPRSGPAWPGLWRAGLLCAALIQGLANAAAAETYWIAPQGTVAAGNGSRAQPWPGLNAAFDSGQLEGGDRLILLPGAHGGLRIGKKTFSPPLTIASGPEGRAHADWIYVNRSTGLRFESLDIWPRPNATPQPRRYIVTLNGGARIDLHDLDLRSAEDATTYESWDKQTWLARARRGVDLGSAGSSLTDSRLTGLYHAVSTSGHGNRVIGNEIAGFAGDGLRVFGAGSVLHGNTVRDCVEVDSNHDDGLQSWTDRQAETRTPIRDITVEANRFLEWTGAPDHPLQCPLQGIGLFDGPYEGWIIRNNLIAVSAHHGLVLNSMRDGVIVNNTVVHIDGRIGEAPWISVGTNTAAKGNIVANNVTNHLKARNQTRRRELLRSNAIVSSRRQFFEDIAAFDFRPSANSPLLNTADPGHAPATDLSGLPRPQGSGPDFGAFERPAP